MDGPIFYLEGGSENRLLSSTAKSRGCTVGAKRKSNDVWDMKKFTLLSLVGITSIALAHAGLAAGHGGGGGGFGGGGFHGAGFGGGGFHGGRFGGGGFRGGGGGHFSAMRGGHAFAPGGIRTWGGRNWGGRNWNGDWRHHNHRFSNDVIFVGDFGFPWWGWGDPYGYYGYDYYPYDSYGYGGYGYGRYGYYDHAGYRHRYGGRSRNMRTLRSR